MATTKDDALEAIARLIKLTQEGTVKWDPAVPSGDLKNREGFDISYIFSTSYKGRRLRLYGFRRRVDDPGPFGTLFTSITLTSPGITTKERTYPYWENGIRLEMSDSEGRSLWFFPEHTMLYDLLSAVRYQVAGVREFLNDLMQE